MKSFLSRKSNLYALLKVFLEDPVFMSCIYLFKSTPYVISGYSENNI